MPLRPRTAPVFGALIAAAFAIYGATQSAQPAPQQKPAPARPGWGRILANTWTELDRDHISVMAAGVAFYGLLSLFPGMSALISVYGLVADPSVIQSDLNALAGILPREALKLVSDQLHALIANSPGKLGFGLVISLLLTLWSAMSGASTVMQALTVANEETDDRGILAFYGRALALTIAAILFAVISLFLVAVVPAIIDRLPLPEDWRNAFGLVRWPLLAALVLLALALVYRFAPAHQSPCWSWFGPGTLAATLLWLLGSAGFSFYVARFSSYDKTYGSLGAVVILLMWFYVGAYIVLAGAELNSEYEKARQRNR
ncbi:MAG TPA: YihY/virulence factor BrkB family protein [Stellaceae bacterium]